MPAPDVMKPFRSAWLAIASALFARTIAAPEAARPQYGGTLRVETQAALRSLDPSSEATDRGEAALVRRVRPLVFETLVQIDPRGGLRPLLATSWESDARNMRWRFRIRRGVVLHDGRQLEPWQIAAALRSVAAGWTISVDEDVVVVEASSSRPDVPWELADSRFAISVRQSPGDIVGTGPFRIERLDGSRLSLRAHDLYWSGRPFVDAIQVEMGRSQGAQLASLEAGRTDVIELSPTEARRATQRGLQVAASRPIDAFALVFEPHRATSAAEPLRRLLAGAVDRAAIANVLLQGRGEPARTLLPSWLSGYPAAIVAPAIARPSRTAGTSLPSDQRNVTLRVDPGDAVARTIADRIAVDAREAGCVVTVQEPAGLAPRPDVRLVRLLLVPSTPDRMFGRIASDLGSRFGAVPSPDSANAGDGTLATVARAERALLRDAVVVPIVHLPELVAAGENVDVWDGSIVNATGGWNLANVWIRGGQR
jgi:peptide/nickel transport system substrate-binding protein